MIRPLNTWAVAGLTALLCVGCTGAAQSAAPPADPPAIQLYAKPFPAAENPERTDTRDGLRVIRNVSEPTLTAFLPDPAKATGAAVIVAPGGAFIMLSYDSEGAMVARRLAEQGVAAFLLKYRLEQTPSSPALFAPVLMRRLARRGRPIPSRARRTASPPRTWPPPTAPRRCDWCGKTRPSGTSIRTGSVSSASPRARSSPPISPPRPTPPTGRTSRA